MSRFHRYLLFIVVALATVAHGNGWCNQPAFQKYSISSPLLFSCDDSELRTEISSLRQEIQQQEFCATQITNEDLQRELKQFCNISALVSEISQLRLEIGMLKDTINAAFPVLPLGSPSNPASNCSEIFQQNSTATTGTYWLSTGDGAVNVTCDFDVQLPPPSPVMGWQEIANINMSDPINSCPSPLRETTNPSIGGVRNPQTVEDVSLSSSPRTVCLSPSCVDVLLVLAIVLQMH